MWVQFCNWDGRSLSKWVLGSYGSPADSLWVLCARNTCDVFHSRRCVGLHMRECCFGRTSDVYGKQSYPCDVIDIGYVFVYCRQTRLIECTALAFSFSFSNRNYECWIYGSHSVWRHSYRHLPVLTRKLPTSDYSYFIEFDFLACYISLLSRLLALNRCRNWLGIYGAVYKSSDWLIDWTRIIVYLWVVCVLYVSLIVYETVEPR